MKVIDRVVRKPNTPNAVADLQRVIDENAGGDWEFCRVETLREVRPVGCFEALFGRSDSNQDVRAAVFRCNG